MEAWALLLILAALLAMAGVALLRAAWSRAGRSPAMTAAGWAALAAASVAGGLSGGAWGIAVASLFGMGLAGAFLLDAARRAPAGKPVRQPREAGRARERADRRILHRSLVFLTTGLGGLLVSIGLGIASRGLAILGGWEEADANSLALLIVPVAWAILLTIFLMQERSRARFATMGAFALPGLAAYAPILLGWQA
ncbi:hypothetical protein B5C34_02975 [Pacificimonas flava]|uniref:Uncharacterized protein n=2 Tax=Pacificimonas TaxID=1960290 RepID=A0A219B3Z0_9SPHN|nr:MULTISPECIES: hypothetical protein [Pacificimonas]MBZ6377816.1 hypothetical protein [Pacificimonas aurantium]OWV32518.1 hypothetical protein B5C34_02975 [Pacificimonas flava]